MHCIIYSVLILFIKYLNYIAGQDPHAEEGA